MKFAVSSYSLSSLVSKGEKTEKELISLAKELGFDAIEFTDLTPPDGLNITEFAEQLRTEAEKNQIEISCYSVSADLLKGSDENLEEEVKKIKKKVDIANVLGVKIMRHDATFSFPEAPLGFNDILPRLAEGCPKLRH